MKTNKTKDTTQKTKEMSNTDPTKNQGVNQAPAKGKHPLPQTRHPPCYSYSGYVLCYTVHDIFMPSVGYAHYVVIAMSILCKVLFYAYCFNRYFSTKTKYIHRRPSYIMLLVID